MLWVALYLPLLSLESFAATLAGEDVHDAGRAIALVDEHCISAVNAAALAQGVKPGLKRATALALAPNIVLGQADPVRDAEAMLPVAHAALAFTPQVSLQPPTAPGRTADTVLLEVQASLRYFGGIDRLLQRLRASVEPLGHALRVASAVTAQGAAVLARVDPPPLCLTLEATQQAVSRAPVWLLGPGRAHWEALQGMGLRRVGDLLGLPRAGLARRFGETLLAELDAAFGRRADPREPIVPARMFDSRLELFARADSSEQVLHGAQVLLARLVAWLAAQHAFVRRFRLLMHHETRWQQGDRTPQATALEIALAEPSRDSAHLLVLLRERLAWLQLPAPTLELALQAEDIVKRAPPNSELFPTRQSEDAGLTRLIERLQARLGVEQVQRLAAVDDHRPERASRLGADAAPVRPARSSQRGARSIAEPSADEAAMAASTCARPVWLQRPEPLAERNARPLLEGHPLALLSGPERIESGWWDAGLAERDYFIAEAGDGALVWIYRARLPLSPEGGNESGWFLQGRFG
ncbi:MAG TPA: DNA polymerase Y family protein [Caldimonas sp.]|jgi:protein ImuB|nr:DNA polymerase Y family protein [Caldimonas sp.]HEX4235556.1 DNA polymerase Y family protein [Caldimonas sp.]